ncbi:MAG: SDR family NAD(P)-dependent oxidoreductase [Promethearchaeota archaeon]
MGRLNEKISIVTGAARKSGIGFGIARKFAEEGSTVILVDIMETIKDRKADLIKMGFQAEAYVVDLTILQDVKKFVADVCEKYQKVDILCNCAGKSIPPRPKFVDMTEKYFDTVMARNLKTTVICCKAVVPVMIKNQYGKIINISSITGTRTAYRYSTAYAASKGAVSGFTRALALEIGNDNINVNAILPGLIDVDEVPWSPENDKWDMLKTPEENKWPINKPGFPEDIGNLACFLASDESRHITGEEIVIDGGSILLEPSVPKFSF